jgi:5,10-methylenetetrahydromethanopterin reductase
MLDREGAAGPGDVAVAGPEDAVAAQLAALAGAGVTDFVAVEFAQGADPPRTGALLKSLASAAAG